MPPSPPSSPELPEIPAQIETRDLIDEGIEPDPVITPSNLPTVLIDMSPTDQFGPDPLIDDPVTGAGNEDLWVNEADPAEEDEEDSEDTGDASG